MTTTISTPYSLVTAQELIRRDDKATLVGVTRALEREALLDPPPGVAATLQDVRFLTAATRRVYAELAARGAPGRLYARSLQAWLAPGVAGIALSEDDPLVDEWTVVLPRRTQPVVFAATDCKLACDDDGGRLFCWAICRDPAVVSAVADLLGIRSAV